MGNFKDIVDSALDTETGIRNRVKGVSKFGWFISPDINCYLPTT